ncbi:MAG: SMC-Scp complex subunit ScpB [Phycisphaerae bacterium]|nr:SMC-Scp complex subunit ScpB [Phycisphaerae bacterium]
MQDEEQDYKDNKLEQSLADEAQAESLHPRAALEGATPTAPVSDAQPVEFVADDAPLQKPAIADEFAGSSGLSLEANEHVQADATNSPTDDDEEETDADIEPLEPEEYETTLETVIEAVLFASDEPLTPKRLVDIAEAGSVKEIRQCVRDLNRKYKKGGFSFRIEKIAGGFQMMTLPAFNPWLSKLIKVRTDNKLSPAALETLAVVSYKQPIIRADVEAIRGVASGEVIRNLMYKGLVKIVGRAEILGRPMLYGTTKKFLDVFGLASLKDLPKVEELKNPEK